MEPSDYVGHDGPHSRSYTILHNLPDISQNYRTPMPGTLRFSRRRMCTTPIELLQREIPEHVFHGIMFYLNKRDLLSFMSTCKKIFKYGLSYPLWEFFNLGNRRISISALHLLLVRRVHVLRLTLATIYPSDFRLIEDSIPARLSLAPQFYHPEAAYALTHLDLSQANFTVPNLLLALLQRCQSLVALSLELCDVVDDAVCEAVAGSRDLEILNLTMVKRLTAAGMRAILDGCTWVRELNLAWAELTDEAIGVVCERLPGSIEQLNFSGTRELIAMNDENVRKICAACPRLIKLDLSDNVHITESCVDMIYDRLGRLEILSLSRCYAIEPTAFLQLDYLKELNVYGCVTEEGYELLRKRMPNVQINASPFSTIARPAVHDGLTTAIWNRRTRDWY